MTDLEQRMFVLEAKMKILEQTVSTLNTMPLPKDIKQLIKQKTAALKMVDLMDSVSEESSSYSGEAAQGAAKARVNKLLQFLEQQAQEPDMDADVFEETPTDLKHFTWEIEYGVVKPTNSWSNSNPERIRALSKYAGKGIRITSYKGGGMERVVIPNEIKGKPVISIGPQAFMNSQTTGVVLPKHLRAIHERAFSSCENLDYISLPDTLEYLGPYCFSRCGVYELNFPNSLTEIPSRCCSDCESLERVNLGDKVDCINYGAFSGCRNVTEVKLPKSLRRVEMNAFENTGIKTMVFPQIVEYVDNKVFGTDRYDGDGHITCVFLGDYATIPGSSFHYVSQVYCLPGGEISKNAKSKCVPTKPLSQFRNGEFV